MTYSKTDGETDGPSSSTANPAGNPSAKPAKIAFHPLVEALVADPGTPPSLVLLVGYAGPSAKAKSVRLYLDPELRAWVEVPEVAVRRDETLGADVVPPLGASLLWLDPDDPAVKKARSVELGGLLDGVSISQENLRTVLPRLVQLLGPGADAVVGLASAQQTSGLDPTAKVQA